MLRTSVAGGLVAFLVLTAAARGAGAQAADPLPPDVRILFQQHCAECHGGERPEAGLRLEAGDAARLDDSAVLETLAGRLRDRTMPPADAERPLPDEARNRLLEWLESRLHSMFGSDGNPGRVTIRRLTKLGYRNTVRDLLGLEVDTSQFPSDDVAEGFNNLADVISLPPLLMEHYVQAAESLSAQWVERELPMEQASNAALLDERLLLLMERAYRRPVKGAERAELTTLYERCREKGFTAGEAAQACVMKILISPQFLYRMEDDGPIGQDRRLDDFELATRLSYFLWSSMPDEELFRLAREGKLQTGETLREQVSRMLGDSKVRQGLVDNFAGQWLQTTRLQLIRPDAAAFPLFDDELRSAMQEETLRLFSSIVQENRPLTELLDADYTFVNQRLAEHYGLPTPSDPATWERVSLEGVPRRGVLTHAGILAINSHPTRTSPVLRGKWIMDAILGTPPPPPPADAGELEAVQVEGTLRERLEAHRSDARCASCHRQMDALGLAFENYDAVGRWRSSDGSRPIDASGELVGGEAFANAVELIRVLRRTETDRFRETFIRKLTVYALGRPLSLHDRPAIDQVVEQVKADDDRIAGAVLAIVNSRMFRFRRNPGVISVEDLGEQFVHEIVGNPEQQATLTVGRNPYAPAPSREVEQVHFTLHTLKPLLGVSTETGGAVTVGDAKGGAAFGEAYRYDMAARVGEPIILTFLKGMIGPHEYSDDFLKPIDFFEETDTSQVVNIGRSQHSWNASLAGPDNIRPGSVVAFDFDVRLVAKPSDTFNVFLATPGGRNRSMFAAGGKFTVEGEGTHRLTRVCRRLPTTHDAWNDQLTLNINTQTQTVVGNLSPLRVIRPRLGIDDRTAIVFNTRIGETAESEPRQIFNAQETSLTDHEGTVWSTVLYGTARLNRDPVRAYLVQNEHVGVELIGKDAGRFELVGDSVTDGGRAMRLRGTDGELGLAGGGSGDAETFRVKFLGAEQGGVYSAAVRVVTQAEGEGQASNGEEGMPAAGLHSIDVPVTATVIAE